MTREELVWLYKALAGRDMLVGSSGNVSARQGAFMLITPTGCDADTLTAEQIVAMNFDGQTSGIIRPSSEWELHAAIYEDERNAQVIAPSVFLFFRYGLTGHYPGCL